MDRLRQWFLSWPVNAVGGKNPCGESAEIGV